ncbi:MAG: rRNA maturation RNase YbeY [Emcibacteraceae bacterium]|nr:rRNA maturation RNase YbeY [Emcibacteraceae bacterium]MDG1858377.1 rRNA maturation RNase YbeY [Emcibacteraceae bacterium]
MALGTSIFHDVSLDDERWKKNIPNALSLVDECLNEILTKVDEGKALSKFDHIEIGFVLSNDAFIHTLNHQYREQDKATNVLSFCGLDDEEITNILCGSDKPGPQPYSLGEIYIAYETVEREAEKANVLIKDHFQHLTIHGILHLLGYDHIEDTEAEIMESLETKLLSDLGIDDPYAA